MRLVVFPTAMSHSTFTLPDASGVMHQCKLVLTKDGYSKFVDESGATAVMYSPGYGNNWVSYASDSTGFRNLCMDSRIIGYKFLGNFAAFDFETFVCEVLGYDEELFEDGFEEIVLEFVPAGALFQIREYDGSEWVEIFDPSQFLSA